MPRQDDPPEYASPPCFRHELDPAWAAPPDDPDPADADAVARWRRAERERLIAARRALSADERARIAAAASEQLDRLLGDVAGLTISAWWPIRSELDFRFWLAGLAERGATAALPVVTEPKRPLAFRRWTPGARMERGFWNIPVPAEGPEVRPDVVLAPVVGFDADGYRLGYGGGYFDRTLASLAPRPRAVGIGLAAARIRTIHPQWHDIAMTAIVTEAGITPDASGSVTGPSIP